MFGRKITITRPDRDRLVDVTRARGIAIRWALFIDDLQKEIDNARIVEPKCVARNVVTMHSRVRLLDRERGQSEVYTLVYPEEANLEAGNLSVLSALGTALLGARKGDVLRVACAAGPRAIKIVSILYQPEAAGDAQQALAARRPSDSVCGSCQGESLAPGSVSIGAGPSRGIGTTRKRSY